MASSSSTTINSEGTSAPVTEVWLPLGNAVKKVDYMPFLSSIMTKALKITPNLNQSDLIVKGSELADRFNIDMDKETFRTELTQLAKLDEVLEAKEFWDDWDKIVVVGGKEHIDTTINVIRRVQTDWKIKIKLLSDTNEVHLQKIIDDFKAAEVKVVLESSSASTLFERPKQPTVDGIPVYTTCLNKKDLVGVVALMCEDAATSEFKGNGRTVLVQGDPINIAHPFLKAKAAKKLESMRASLGSTPIAVVLHQKGKSLEEILAEACGRELTSAPAHRIVVTV